jgi:hypothetical protein
VERGRYSRRMLCFCSGGKRFIAALEPGRRRQTGLAWSVLCTSEIGIFRAAEPHATTQRDERTGIACMSRGRLPQQVLKWAWTAVNALRREATQNEGCKDFGHRCTSDAKSKVLFAFAAQLRERNGMQ